MTPLAAIIAQRIRATGPITLADYMEICLLHPRHGYYATRDPFGAGGDFTTAPEIHQMFGELCGLALAQAWIDQGRPAPFTLAEAGPGRGTMMADMLRAIRVVPGMANAAQVALIEASPHLRQIQRDRLGPVNHLDHVGDMPDKPLFLMANEFFDALPIRQYQRVEGGWAERVVGLSDGGLRLGLGPAVQLSRDGRPGDVVEDCPAAPAMVEAIARRIAARGGAAILIDYGGWNGLGDTFQAVRNHAPENPLDHPGEADLTAHVDFAPLAAAAIRAGAVAARLVCQGDWLVSLGAAQRAERLAAAGDAGAVAALRRLTHPDEMGHLFKAIAIWPKGAPPVPGFDALRLHADHA
ncbi:class I SAM-dependent methyltransferase [Paracoccus sediminis]|uniref:Class I SAM-dependent methyltransferase n=1 Tax=Paracoccus sediminis TaxID=1214787 RepID=A0A238XF28_9RHOB|nr:SAM-dependent methyltransferase [Paracoccus sediminis]TBN49674.1 class I SAM-dependent methyltransferase [Paracoccus sediminis]SNR57093.1 SAM-dependent methyltransferase, MidA family [Paracoccus sediminis]